MYALVFLPVASVCVSIVSSGVSVESILSMFLNSTTDSVDGGTPHLPNSDTAVRWLGSSALLVDDAEAPLLVLGLLPAHWPAEAREGEGTMAPNCSCCDRGKTGGGRGGGGGGSRGRKRLSLLEGRWK